MLVMPAAPPTLKEAICFYWGTTQEMYHLQSLSDAHLHCQLDLDSASPGEMPLDVSVRVWP